LAVFTAFNILANYKFPLNEALYAKEYGSQMKVQIKNISGHQTSKVFALTFAILMLPFSFIAIFFFFMAPGFETPNGESMPSFPFLFFALAPIFYGVMFYFMQRIFCWAYNIVAKKFGGFEFETNE
jgi:hypothetical protein